MHHKLSRLSGLARYPSLIIPEPAAGSGSVATIVRVVVAASTGTTESTAGWAVRTGDSWTIGSLRGDLQKKNTDSISLKGHVNKLFIPELHRDFT